MQPERYVSVFRCVVSRLVELNLVKRQLLGALAGNVLKMHRRQTKIVQRKVIHIVTGRDRIQHIGFQHGVDYLCLDAHAMPSHHTDIVLKILTYNGFFRVLE